MPTINIKYNNDMMSPIKTSNNTWLSSLFTSKKFYADSKLWNIFDAMKDDS